MMGQWFGAGAGWAIVCGATLLVALPRAQAQVGAVVGQVVDAGGETISAATVEKKDTDIRGDTNAEGRYRLELEAGTHELRVVAPFYLERLVPGVVVRSGAETPLDVTLESSGVVGVETLEVIGTAYGGSETQVLVDRQLASVLSDSVSAEMIKLSPDSDVAEIVQRVPAVTIQDNKYLNVRGLNERYTSALLNGNRLPSTDPLRRSVPLDLFPAGFIESISIIKTYTPDLPGDFSGGLASIELKPYPEDFTLDVGVSTKLNTNTTFQEFRTYEGAGAADWFGYGNEFRGYPQLIPDDVPLRAPNGSLQRAYAAGFRNIWDTEPTTAAPGYTIGVSAGGKLLDNLGTALGVTYGTEWKYRDDEKAATYDDSEGELFPEDDFEYSRSVFETTLGVVSTTGFEITENHELTLRGIYNRASEDQVLDGRGTLNNEDQIPLIARNISYVANELAWGQVGGVSRFDWLDVDWRTALSRTMQDTPDSRYEVRLIEENGTTAWTNQSNSGRRVFGNLEEYMTDSAMDFTVPFKTWLPFTDVWSGLDASAKFGPAYMFRDREHTLRNFRYGAIFQSSPLLLAPTEDLLNPDNIPNVISFGETTQPRDSFTGTHEIAALYGMLELPILGGWEDEEGELWHQLRVIGGVRGEYSYIVVNTFGDGGFNDPKQPILNDLDALPGINVVYSPIEDVNLRFAWSQAVSRPELRELSPVLFPATSGLRAIVGNEDLVSASIESYDVRAEWFVTPSEVLSFSVFYKELEDPIEASLISVGSIPTDTFANADEATLVGFEIEGRASLDRLTDYLEGFSFSTNVTYTDSTAKIGERGGQVASSDDRELQGQAPFVVNAALDYTHDDWGTVRALYNTIGDRLSTVSPGSQENIFEQRRDQLDLVYLTEINPFGTPLNVKLAVENILDDDYEFAQGDETTQKWKTGVSFSFGLSYSY